MKKTLIILGLISTLFATTTFAAPDSLIKQMYDNGHFPPVANLGGFWLGTCEGGDAALLEIDAYGGGPAFPETGGMRVAVITGNDDAWKRWLKHDVSFYGEKELLKAVMDSGSSFNAGYGKENNAYGYRGNYNGHAYWDDYRISADGKYVVQHTRNGNGYCYFWGQFTENL